MNQLESILLYIVYGTHSNYQILIAVLCLFYNIQCWFVLTLMDPKYCKNINLLTCVWNCFVSFTLLQKYVTNNACFAPHKTYERKIGFKTNRYDSKNKICTQRNYNTQAIGSN